MFLKPGICPLDALYHLSFYITLCASLSYPFKRFKIYQKLLKAVEITELPRFLNILRK